MPQPNQGDVHVNRPLTNLSSAIIQDETNFVATQVFPIVPSQSQGNIYFVYDNAYWTSDEMQLRGPSEESAGSGYSVDATNNFFCKLYAFHKDIPDQVRSNADVPINVDDEATKLVTQKALLKRETLFAAAYMAAGVWTNYDYAGVASGAGANQVIRWDVAASTPVEDVWNAKTAILQATGLDANVLCLTWSVYKTLVNHAEIVDRVKAGQTPNGPAVVDTSDLAQVFKVDKVVVAKAIKNTAAEGRTMSGSFIMGKGALLVHAADAPGIMTASAGYIFAWTGYLGAGGTDGQVISRFRIQEKKTDRVEIEMAFDMKLISVMLGAYWDALVL